MRQIIVISCFLLTLLGFANAENQQQLFQQLLVKLQVMRGDFQQTIFGANGDVIQRSSGKMALKRPGKFRWYTLKPNKQLLVADGKNLWIYDVDLEQATVRQQDQGIGESPALLLSGTSAILSKEFTVDKLRSKVGERYKLLPKASSGSFKMVLLHFEHNKLIGMDLYDKLEQHIKLAFSQVSTQSAANKLFNFIPPKGVDVIGKVQHKWRSCSDEHSNHFVLLNKA